METENCPTCKKPMQVLYNDFFAPARPKYRGLVCENKDCKQYGLERRHPKQYQRFSDKDFEEYKKANGGFFWWLQ